jgi:hypothetical protein
MSYFEQRKKQMNQYVKRIKANKSQQLQKEGAGTKPFESVSRVNGAITGGENQKNTFGCQRSKLIHGTYSPP